jgi:CRP-like cAMP-binding protein
MSQDKRPAVRLVELKAAGSADSDGAGRLIRMLRTLGEVQAEDEQAIRELPGTVRQLDAYEDIVVEGEKPDSVTVLVKDISCRYKVTPDGRRQILSFHIAGDVPDLQSLFLHTMDHSLCTLEPSTIWQIPHAAMLSLFDRSPRVNHLFWRSSLIEASIFREWMLNIGQREAKGRIAHLLCELMVRMKMAGLSDGATCLLPITQSEIADATGMSHVHVNRSLQTLRLSKLIQWRAASLTVLDWDRLADIGQFDPSYLHLS